MDTADKKQQILIFEKSRNNLLLVIAFTVINLVLIYFDANVNFLFSATIPQFVFNVAKLVAEQTDENIFFVIGLIIAFIAVLSYFIFWLLARRTRVLILAALIFFCIDSLLLIYLVFNNDEFNFSVLMEIAFHAWILYYLFTGVKAWSKLRGVSTEVYNTLLQEIKSVNILQTNPNAPYVSNNETTENNNSASEENSPAKEDNNFYYDENKPENK
jgi:hypothetical protein